VLGNVAVPITRIYPSTLHAQSFASRGFKDGIESLEDQHIGIKKQNLLGIGKPKTAELFEEDPLYLAIPRNNDIKSGAPVQLGMVGDHGARCRVTDQSKGAAQTEGRLTMLFLSYRDGKDKSVFFIGN
jgi:hypothetical protein